MNPSKPENRSRRATPRSVDRIPGWLLLFGLWSLLALVSALQSTWIASGAGVRLPFRTTFPWQLPQWWSWALLTPLIAAGDARAREHGGIAVLAIVHVLLAAGTVLIHSVVVVAADHLFFPGQVVADPWASLVDHLQHRVQFELLAYGLIVGIVRASLHYRERRESAVIASQLTAELARAELATLKNRLQPHFLFNTLQAISVLSRRAPERVTESLVVLSELYRDLLATAGTQTVALRDELAFVRRYLSIAELRFADRLLVGENIASETLDVVVPHLVLQPLVENALQHGIQPKRGSGAIAISACRRWKWLILEVTDDGVGLTGGLGSSNGSSGVGLSVLRSRLRYLHPESSRLSVRSRPGGGVRARVILPFVPAVPVRASREGTE